MLNEKITLDQLTETSVSVKRQKYIVDDGVEYNVGPPHRRAYQNSVRERAELMIALSGNDLEAVLAKWGPAPTVIESMEE